MFSADLAAALGLVLALEGLAAAIFSGRLHDLAAALSALDPGAVRTIGLALAAVGAGLYVLIRV